MRKSNRRPNSQKLDAEPRQNPKASQRNSDDGKVADGLRSDYSTSAFDQHVAAISRSAGSSQGAEMMRKLQQGYGNAYVQRVVEQAMQGRIQTKLAVGPAGDQYEQEADKTAKQVMDTMQRQAAPEEEELMQAKRLQRQAPEEEELMQAKRLQRQATEEEELQAKHLQRQAPEEEELAQAKRLQRQTVIGEEGGDLDSQLAGQIDGQRGKGQSLPDDVRSNMEQAFGADFSNVRVHTDAQADALNDSVSARAFTTGSDIFVRRSEYNPGSHSGQELLAHELTHVVQQGAAGQRDVDEHAKS
ncbi:MAG: eCIS core domain-containing protein [Ardenticatenaceae bacterium]